jgi:hypothetical protein
VVKGLQRRGRRPAAKASKVDDDGDDGDDHDDADDDGASSGIEGSGSAAARSRLPMRIVFLL